VLRMKEHLKPVKDPKRQEAGHKVAKIRKKKRDALLAELAAAKEKVHHAHNTDAMVPKELEKMEDTHSVAP